MCDDGWDLDDAQVVCRQLGFGPAVVTRDGEDYGEGSGQIWLGNLNCTSSELSIEYCSHSGWGIVNCSHADDVAIQCATSNGKFIYMYIISYNYCICS